MIFSKWAFSTFKHQNFITRHRIELLGLLPPLWNIIDISKLTFPTLCMFSQIASHIDTYRYFWHHYEWLNWSHLPLIIPSSYRHHVGYIDRITMRFTQCSRNTEYSKFLWSLVHTLYCLRFINKQTICFDHPAYSNIGNVTTYLILDKDLNHFVRWWWRNLPPKY